MRAKIMPKYACARHSFDRGLHDNVAVETALNAPAWPRSFATRLSASAWRKRVQKTLQAFNVNAPAA